MSTAEDADHQARLFIQEVWGLQGTAYLFVGLRYYSKLSTVGLHNFAWDDFLMFLAVLVYTAESVMAYFVVAYWKGLANNAMTDEQRASLDPNSEEWYLRVNGSKTHVVGLLLYTTLLWLLKACWLVYYARLTKGINNDKLRLMINWGIVIMSATYIASLLVAFLKCIPFDHQWQIYPTPSNNCMPAISTLQTVFVMVMNTITDFYLMAIPLPVIWESHLPLRKKFGVLLMFSGGVLEMAFGILRCVSILTKGDTDPAQSGYWSVRESFVSVVTTNLPLVYPLFKGIIEKGLSASRSKAGTTTDSRGYRLNSVQGRGTTSKKDPFSVPNETSWGSKEHIVVEPGANSSGEEASLDLPKQKARPFFGDSKSKAEVTVTSNPDGSERARRPTANTIVVTTEYTVKDSAVGSSTSHSRQEF
ncbi:hypothetical protein F5X96DRAFT_629647 [Biscogniauxia mediterranea]|nr:hypothetical protein F5X96DRAFT_629647 [Biscogniauxia mediterranea]